MKEKRLYNLDSEHLVRAELIEENNESFLVGYASVFGVKSKPIYENNRFFHEYIEKGAFDEVMKTEPDVVMTFNHDRSKILGRTSSGTLKLEIDEIGLKFRLSVPNTTLGKDTLEMVQRNDYKECSFVFTVSNDGQKWSREDGTNIRRIKSVSGLYDVAVCAVNGAYSNTDIDAETIARNLDILEKPEENGDEEIERKFKTDSAKLQLIKLKGIK